LQHVSPVRTDDRRRRDRRWRIEDRRWTRSMIEDLGLRIDCSGE
jgi:hypothetical protein